MKKCPRCGKEYGDTTTLCPSDGTVLKKNDELVGQTLTGKYRIDERISEGGMGCVYKATHVLMEKTVAIKVLHPALAADDNIVARFTREARAASRISHPHALVVTDFGESENGVVFLVMEYLRGRTLKEVIRAEGPLELKRVAEIVRQVAGALDAAHSEGVVHRDLKSDNIMLDEASGGGDWAKVLDFGIAKIKETVESQDPGLTAPNLIIGTPQYMSPEQCSQASNIDARSDIYSLGVILYEMLAGHVPFSGGSPTEVMMKHMQEPVPSLREDRADIAPAVERVVQRAMAKRPEERFQSAGELSEVLLLAASGDPLLEGAAADTATAHPTRMSATDGQGAPATNRIIVPTGENEPPRHTGSEDADESTVVSARARTGRDTGQYMPAPAPAPPPPAMFNPWRIAIPAVALLAIVFAMFYVFRGNESSGETQTQPLSTDPNSQPVVSVTPPTGEGERNLTPSTGLATPTPDLLGGGGVTAGANLNGNTAAAATPTPDEQPEENENTGEEEEPPPARTPANANRRVNPTPPPATTNTDVNPSAPRKTAPTPPPPSTGAEPAPAGPHP